MIAGNYKLEVIYKYPLAETNKTYISKSSKFKKDQTTGIDSNSGSDIIWLKRIIVHKTRR